MAVDIHIVEQDPETMTRRRTCTTSLTKLSGLEDHRKRVEMKKWHFTQPEMQKKEIVEERCACSEMRKQTYPQWNTSAEEDMPSI